MVQHYFNLNANLTCPILGQLIELSVTKGDNMGTVNFERLMKKINQAGLSATTDDNRRFYVEGPYYYGSFFKQDDKAVCVSTCRNGDKPDGMYDYFPQTYHDTMKSFIKWVKFDGNWDNKEQWL